MLLNILNTFTVLLKFQWMNVRCEEITTNKLDYVDVRFKDTKSCGNVYLSVERTQRITKSYSKPQMNSRSEIDLMCNGRFAWQAGIECKHRTLHGRQLFVVACSTDNILWTFCSGIMIFAHRLVAPCMSGCWRIGLQER